MAVTVGGSAPTNQQKQEFRAAFGVGHQEIVLHTANGYGSTGNKIRRFSTVLVNEGTDISVDNSSVNGCSFTINADGIYAIEYFDNFNAIQSMAVTKNNGNTTTGVDSLDVATVLAECSTGAASHRGNASCVAILAAGDVIRPHTGGAPVGSLAAKVKFSIKRIG